MTGRRTDVRARRTAGAGIAGRLLPLAERVLGARLPLRLRAWDGSEAGPEGAPLVVLRSRDALRRLLWEPGELGLAQAYVTGELDLDGDLTGALRTLGGAARGGGGRAGRLGPVERARAAATVVGLGAVGRRPEPPATQARLRGARHSRARDRAAISHHYDLSNEFYALLLDETMAYSCGYWTSGAPGYGPADAQRDKLELICRKLGLRPGARLLDIGCGWGSLTLYAAGRHGARVLAVTLSREQAAHVRTEVERRGLEDRVEVRHADYRDLRGPEHDGAYDAVASVEMGEHVGDGAYPGFAAGLRRSVRPGGRVLVQQMARGALAPGGGAFIEAYIAPDMHMRPLGDTVSLLEGAGLEVRATESLREHYVRTIAAWGATLDDRWAEFTELVGEETARVWRLYLAGGRLAFEEGRMGVDQILAVRPAGGGTAVPVAPAGWYTP